MPGQIDAATKKVRSAELIALGKAKRAAFAAAFIGKPVTALVEKIDAAGAATGWTDQYLPVRIAAPDMRVNDVISFTPTQVDGHTLT